MSSIPHLQTTPGFVDWGWPPDEGNFQPSRTSPIWNATPTSSSGGSRSPTRWSSLIQTTNVIGCVYVDPGDLEGDASVRSWVRADVAELDGPFA